MRLNFFCPIALLSLVVPVSAQIVPPCTRAETLSTATQELLGKAPDQVTVADLTTLKPDGLARIYLAADTPLLSDVVAKDLPITNLSGANFGLVTSRIAFRPQVNSPSQTGVGVWYFPTNSTNYSFREYFTVSSFDSCPVLRLNYNLNPNPQDYRRGRNEIRRLNSNTLLSVYLSASDLNQNSNPNLPLNTATNYVAVDLSKAQPLNTRVFPSNLGWPWVGSTPVGNPCSSPWQPRFSYDTTLYPFTNRCLSLRFGNVHYFDETPAEAAKGTVLMVHGNPVWSFNYRDIAKSLLAQGYRVVAMDYYGFGLSDAPDSAVYGYTPHEQSETLTEFVEALNLTDFTLIVHDWGGPTGLAMAGQMPDRVKNLLIMNTWGFNLPGIPPWSNLNFLYANQIVTTASIPKSVGETLGLLYGPKDSPDYLNVRNAYWGGFLDPATGTALSPTVALPTNIFAQNIALDRDFLGETDRTLQANLAAKPVYFIYSLRSVSDLVGLQGLHTRWQPNAILGTYLSPVGQHFITEYEQPKIIEAFTQLNTPQ